MPKKAILLNCCAMPAALSARLKRSVRKSYSANRQRGHCAGEDGIRTHVSFRTNGFQDRLVMTASIPLHFLAASCDFISLPYRERFVNSIHKKINNIFFLKINICESVLLFVWRSEDCKRLFLNFISFLTNVRTAFSVLRCFDVFNGRFGKRLTKISKMVFIG